MPAALPDHIRTALAPLEAALSAVASQSRSGRAFALAYSGGMDSRFLAHAAGLLGFEPQLFMAVGPHVPPEEEKFGEAWTCANGFPFRKLEVDTLSLPLVAVNDKRRCYECKRAIFSRLMEYLTSEGGARLALCDGTNSSDALSYRPGTQAVKELGVLSPLAMAGLNKADIYRLAALTGMERPDQKPRPCLLTRLPYGVKPDASTLRALAAGEQAVRLALEAAGMPEADFRLRLVLRGEVLRSELHLLQGDTEALPPAVAEQLPHAIAEAAPSLPSLVFLVPQVSLSGFFDKAQPSGNA